jgi:hypothetical protein
MNRASRIILALMLLFMASPALAAIDRFTDDKGTLHITNNSKEKARLEESDEDTSAPQPRRLPRRPAAVQPPPEAEQPEPAPAPEPAEMEEAKPSSYLTVQKGVIRITNVNSRPVDLAQTQSSAPTPVPAAAVEPAAPVIPVSLAQAAPALATPALTPIPAGASVKCRRDKKGVIHITNAPAKPFQGNIMVAGWSPGAEAWASQEAAVASKAMGTALSTKPESREALPISKASLLESAPLAILPVMPAAVSGASVGSAKVAKTKVRRFRDGKGIIHIVGKGPAPEGALPAPPDRMIAQAGLPPASPGFLHQPLPGPPAAWPEPTVALRKDKQGRLVIQNAPRGHVPKGDKEEICRRLSPVMVEAAYLHGLPVSLIEAVIKVESNFQPAAVSPKGAMGLMQLMPGTAKFLGVEDAFSPRENVLGGTRYLRLLLDFFGQSLPLALAAYNAGFQRVIDAGSQVPNIKETQDFVARVMGHYHLREKQRLAQRLML